jgi:hypothetical protein
VLATATYVEESAKARQRFSVAEPDHTTRYTRVTLPAKRQAWMPSTISKSATRAKQ